MRRISILWLILAVVVLSGFGCSIRKKGSHVFPGQDVSADGSIEEDALPDQDSLVPDVGLDQVGLDAEELVPEDLLDAADETAPDLIPVDALETTDGSEVVEIVDDVTPECEVADDCPKAEGICEAAFCLKGKCQVGSLPADAVPVVDSQEGDCQFPLCDGNGGYALVLSPTDFPKNDNPCVKVWCDGTTPATEPVAVGTACGEGLICDGNAQCVGCGADEDCPGEETECGGPLCDAGVCSMAYAAEGTLLTLQDENDCLVGICDGAGNEKYVSDDTETPLDDGNECTIEECSGGGPVAQVALEGTECTYEGGSVCASDGTCVDCLVDSDCGASTECQQPYCTAEHLCDVVIYVGTVLTDALPGDCTGSMCDASGVPVAFADGADVFDDGEPCTLDWCDQGQVKNDPVAEGTGCGAGWKCDGIGNCVQCLTAMDCPGGDTACGTRTCVANVCGMSFTAAGTVVSLQTPGDCQLNQCDGAGNVVSSSYNVDLPVDGNECTSDVCTAGFPSNPPAPTGTACNQNGGSVCDGSGVCVACTAPEHCSYLGQTCYVPQSKCVPYSCTDSVKNGIETDVDCGGSLCQKCTLGKTCQVATDCLSGGCLLGLCG